MGRGRAKAKQVKVARQLKYSGGGMDLDRLRAEIGTGTDQRDAGDSSAFADEHSARADDRFGADEHDDEDDFADDEPGERAFG